MKIHWQPRMALVLLEALCLPAQLGAQIVHDTTLGTACGVVIGSPSFTIRPECGVRHEGNLFHSFSQFSLGSGETAIFSGPTGVKNIMARVTGGSASTINGLLQVTIDKTDPTAPRPEANLYLINPWGVIFGPGAQLDVNGAFTATTASYLKLADGGKFNAVNPGQSSLSMADPVRFGFLNSTPKEITVEGSRLTGSRSLALVGGDIAIKKSAELAPGLGGQISLTSVKSAGEFSESPDPGAFSRGGKITVAEGSSVGATANNFFSGGGRIVIRGGDLVVESSSSVQHRVRPMPGQPMDFPGGIDIALKGLLSILGGGSIISINDSGVVAKAKSGPISIRAGQVKLGAPALADQASSSIASTASGDRSANDVTIKAGSVEINGSGIVANVASSGAAGKTLIDAESVVINGPGGSFNGGQAQGNIGTSSGGAGGDVEIHTQTLVVNGGSVITKIEQGGAGAVARPVPGPSQGPDGKNVTVNAGKFIKLFNANIDAASDGNGGNVNFAADGFILTQDSTLSAAGSAGGGNVFFKAPMVSIKDSILNAAAPAPNGRVGVEACAFEFERNAVAAAAGLQADIMVCETRLGGWPQSPPRDDGWPPAPLPPGLPPPTSIPDLMKQTPLAPECGVKFDISSFIVRGRGGVALEPGGWQPAVSMPQVSPVKK